MGESADLRQAAQDTCCQSGELGLQLRFTRRGHGAEPYILIDGFVCAIEHQHVQVHVAIV